MKTTVTQLTALLLIVATIYMHSGGLNYQKNGNVKELITEVNIHLMPDGLETLPEVFIVDEEDTRPMPVKL